MYHSYSAKVSWVHEGAFPARVNEVLALIYGGEHLAAGTGNKEAVEELERFIRDFVRDLGVQGVSGGCCVTSKTRDKAGPYVDSVTSGLFVAGGGCG